MNTIWDKLIFHAKNIDSWRKVHMAFAEWFDAWRLIPRLLVAGYAYMLWEVVNWYMNIVPTMIVGCNIDKLKEACISQAPTTQDAVLVTAVIGIAAAVFGLYTGSGKKWNGFTLWNTPTDSNSSDDSEKKSKMDFVNLRKNLK